MNKVTLTLLFLVIVSCKNNTTPKIDVSDVNTTFTIDRFELQFYNTSFKNLPELKQKYPFLFPVQTPDSIWMNRIKNEKELFRATEKVFFNFKNTKTKIATLFKHIKYYSPNFKEPKIITLITNLDYQSRVIYTGDFLFLSLDMYLGEDNNLYTDFPKYISQNFTKNRLIVDIAKAIIQKQLKPNTERQFIDIMIAEGKKMYLLDAYLPNVADRLKIGYSEKKIHWAKNNEIEIWKYFISNNLLYQTDKNLKTRFITPAPFSKFYLDIDNNSPGQIGIWIGWQIVRSYIKNNNVTLSQFLQTNTEEIFSKSKYKPNK